MSTITPTVALGETVRVRNLGDEPIKLAYNSVPITIPVGGDAVLPREAASIHFGDWTKRGKARVEEYGRVRAEKGCPVGAVVDVNHPNYDEASKMVPTETLWNEDGKWGKARKPLVEIVDFATGQRVTSIIDDPAGETLPVDAAPDLTRQLDLMRAELDRLTKLASAQEGIVSQTAPEDSPENAVQRRPTRAKVEAPTRRDGERLVRDD